MKTLYIECSMGAAGDMLMAALLELLPDNDAPAGQKAVRKYRCKVCGEVFEVERDQEAVCPLCKATGDKLERIG